MVLPLKGEIWAFKKGGSLWFILSDAKDEGDRGIAFGVKEIDDKKEKKVEYTEYLCPPDSFHLWSRREERDTRVTCHCGNRAEANDYLCEACRG